MATKKKQKLDEGMVMISSLLPVGGLIGMPPKRKDNFVFKGLPGQFDKDGNKTLDEYGDPLKEETDFIAFYGGKKTPIKGTDLWDAKKKAIALLKIPKSKQGLLAIKSQKSMDAGDFRFEGKVNEDSRWHNLVAVVTKETGGKFYKIQEFVKQLLVNAGFHGEAQKVNDFMNKV